MPEQGRQDRPRVERVGDAALLAILGDDLDLALNAWAHRATDALAARREATPGLGHPVPGHGSVLVPFDPGVISEDAVRTILAEILDGATQPSRPRGGRLHEIPVGYGGVDGPDLAAVASQTGRSEADVVRLHAGVEHRVLVLGFVPGFPYLGILPAALELPRRSTPRLRVPAGSVAIAGLQTGIYPFETPGGWHLIGRTDAALWDPVRDPPALLAPGDRVRFVAR